MTSYPYASDGKIQSTLDALGTNAIGSQEVTLWKQILVSVANGGITPPSVDPITGLFNLLRLQTYRSPQDLTPLGINPVAGGANPTWSDVMSGTGQATQSNAIQRFLTQYENGVPILSADGVDDWMTTDIESSEVDSEGSFLAVFSAKAPLDYDTPVGGTFGGRALCSESNVSSWGLSSPGIYGPLGVISMNPLAWFSLAVSWNNTLIRYNFKSRSSGGGVSEVASTSVSSAPGKLGIGLHITNSPYSYMHGNFVAIGIGDKLLTTEQLEQASDYGATLFPPP